MDNSFLNKEKEQPKHKLLLRKPKKQTRAERTLKVEPHRQVTILLHQVQESIYILGNISLDMPG